MAGASMICMGTYGNGVRTGLANTSQNIRWTPLGLSRGLKRYVEAGAGLAICIYAGLPIATTATLPAAIEQPVSGLLESLFPGWHHLRRADKGI